MDDQQPPQPLSPQSAPHSLSLKKYLPFAGIVAALAVLAWALFTNVSMKKELLETRHELSKSRQVEEAQRTQVTQLKSAVSAYERNRKTRRTQKVALDGKGEPVRMANGDPLVLETVVAISSSSGSTATFEETRTITELRRKLFETETQRDSYKKTSEERHGAYASVMADAWTDGSFGGHGSGPILGRIQAGAGFKLGGGEFAASASAGLGF